jgi:prevent-host-death family protein
MKTFSYSDLRSNLAEVFKLVSNGEEVVISKNKGRKMVAVLSDQEFLNS